MIAALLASVLAIGTASWYPAHGMIAAAGPALRHGDWRGSQVQVCASRCIVVTLADWCACYGSRVIDLSDDAFRRLAPLSRGLLHVTVSGIGVEATLPPTDTVLRGPLLPFTLGYRAS